MSEYGNCEQCQASGECLIKWELEPTQIVRCPVCLGSGSNKPIDYKTVTKEETKKALETAVQAFYRTIYEGVSDV